MSTETATKKSAKETVTEESFFDEIYKNTKMGADAIIYLLPRVRDDALRSVLTMQLDGYEKFATGASQALEARGREAKEENIFTRMSTRFGISMNTMMDSSSGHIAEMMIEGSNMGITDMTKLLNNFETDHPDSEAVRLAHDVMHFEEHNLELLKRYL